MAGQQLAPKMMLRLGVTGLAREGGCLFRLCGHQETADNLSQTRIFHILTLNGVLGIVPQLVISAIIGYCFRIHSRISSCLKLNIRIRQKRTRRIKEEKPERGDKGRGGE